MAELAPSILAADFNHLGKDIAEVEQAGIHYLHVDVMDGMFVPSISFGMPVIASIRKASKMFFDVHLMIENPIRYIKDFVDAGADGITVHAEACEDLEKTIQEIKKYGVKAAVAINPDTPLEAIDTVLNQVDMVLIMSVFPGKGGQKLIEETIDKAACLNRKREEKNSFLIEMDGGINKDTLERVAASGVDLLVAGTAVFRGNIAENINVLKEVMSSAS